MGPDSVFTHEGAVRIGPAQVLFWDSAKSAWHRFAMMDGVSIAKEVDEAEAVEINQNVKSAMKIAQTGLRYRVKGTIMETVNPDVLDLIFGDGMTSRAYGAAAVIEESEVINLCDEKAIPLIHCDIASSLAPPTDATIALSGAGSTLDNAAWYVWVTASYGASDTHHSAPATTTPTNVTVTAGDENILVEWVAPADGNPNHYTVWASKTNNIATALAAGTTTSMSYLINANPAGAAYNATDTDVFTVTSYDGVSTYVADSDYYWDETFNTIRRIEGGDIDNGNAVIVTYNYNGQAYTQGNIGAGRMQPRYAKLRIIQLAAEDTDADGGFEETGLIFELEKVSLLSGTELPFNKDDFEGGMAVDLKALRNPVTNRFGRYFATHPVMENWEGIDAVIPGGGTGEEGTGPGDTDEGFGGT